MVKGQSIDAEQPLRQLTECLKVCKSNLLTGTVAGAQFAQQFRRTWLCDLQLRHRQA
jgi:hypothetical protein